MLYKGTKIFEANKSFPFTFPSDPTIYMKTKTRYQLDLITQQGSLDAIFIYAPQSVLSVKSKYSTNDFQKN